MKYQAEERNWEKYWPDSWPRYLDYGEMPIVWYVYRNALRHPQKTAFIYYGRRITYLELHELVFRAAGELRRLGVKKGDRVYIGMENCPQFVVCYYAVHAVGAIIVAGSPMFKESEMKYLMNDAGTTVAILEEQQYPIFTAINKDVPVKHLVITSLTEYIPQKPEIPVPSGLQHEGEIDYSKAISWQDFVENEPIYKIEDMDIMRDIACLQYTSGTTGFPKGTILTHYNLLSNSIQLPVLMGQTANDIYGSMLPFFHIAGQINGMNGPVIFGTTAVLFTRFDPVSFFKASELYKITMLTSITTMNIAFLNYPELNKYDLSSWKVTGTGGAPVSAELMNKWFEQFKCPLQNSYGMTETAASVIANPAHATVPGSIGIPVYVDVRIADMNDTSKNVPRGQQGELWLKGASIARGYWNRPQEIQDESFKDDNWLATGDIVTMDEDGYIFIEGRMKEMIKASGYSVFPAEVEHHLFEHEAVQECAVIGVTHEYRGEDIKAYIVLKNEWKGKITEEDIIVWAREHMAVYKYPRQVEFREALPKSAAGKIMRKDLKQEVF